MRTRQGAIMLGFVSGCAVIVLGGALVLVRWAGCDPGSAVWVRRARRSGGRG
ncbi:hypothetical protein [Nonomuraea salmonea]|uniref:hypothetical protein n=1 Tax=Nonomuraea salmonea TaxID=46181 RepID=UPI0031E92234